MKKIVLALLSIIMVTTLITACSASDSTLSAPGEAFRIQSMPAGGGGDFADEAAMYAEPSARMPEPAPAAAPEPDVYYAVAEEGYDDTGGISTTVTKINYAEKIIYSCHAYIETLSFDETLESVQKLINAHGAFIESSSIDGSNLEASYRGWPRYRSAYFSIRVPAGQLSTVTSKLDTLGHVVSQSSNAQNITSQFMDTESRLNSLRIQEERLLDMLKKAEDVTDLITIETHLADVRYQIEQLTTTLNHWQHQVDYSTLSLSISEVEEITEQLPINRTYWERMGDGIIASLKSVGRFFMDLFMWLAVSAPVLLILAAAGIAAFFIIRSKIRKSKAKAAEKQKNAPPVNGQPYQANYYQHGIPTGEQKPAEPQTPAEASQETFPGH